MIMQSAKPSNSDFWRYFKLPANMTPQKLRLPFSFSDLEHRHEKLISPRDFFHRMLLAPLVGRESAEPTIFARIRMMRASDRHEGA
jgi:hypothetical protein